jgi:hypothetical protein
VRPHGGRAHCYVLRWRPKTKIVGWDDLLDATKRKRSGADAAPLRPRLRRPLTLPSHQVVAEIVPAVAVAAVETENPVRFFPIQ